LSTLSWISGFNYESGLKSLHIVVIDAAFRCSV